MSARWFVVALVAVTLVPLALGAAVVAWRTHADGRQELEQGLLERASALAVAVDREIEVSIAALENLATSDHLDTGDLRRFYAQARRARDARPMWRSVVLMDATGGQLLNLLRPLGTALPSMASVPVFQETVRTRQPAVSDLFMSPTAGQWLVAVNVPVLRDGILRYVLSAGMSPDGFVSLLGAVQPADALAMVIDRRGTVVAHNRDQDGRVGRPAELGVTANRRPTERAVVRVHTEDGGVYAAFGHVARSGFGVGLALPVGRVDGPLRRSLEWLAVAASAVFTLSLGLAFLAGCGLTRRTAALGDALTAFGRGEPVRELPGLWVTELKGVGQALRDAIALLHARSAALRQSEAALRVSEERYRRLTEESAEGIIIHQDGVQRLVNAAAAGMLGYERPADALGRPVAAHIAPEHRDVVLARIEARLRGEPVAMTNELEVVRRDGSRFWIEATAAVVDWEGRPATRVAILDITERRRRDTAEREADNLRSVAMLANAAAHEINNPLTIATGSLELVQAGTVDRPSAQASLERARRALMRIAELVGQMQRITRLELLKGFETGGVPTLDLRRSSDSEPEDTPSGSG